MHNVKKRETDGRTKKKRKTAAAAAVVAKDKEEASAHSSSPYQSEPEDDEDEDEPERRSPRGEEDDAPELRGDSPRDSVSDLPSDMDGFRLPERPKKDYDAVAAEMKRLQNHEVRAYALLCRCLTPSCCRSL